MTLWLVRHAQPLVAAGVCYGQTNVLADACATHACAQALAKILPSSVAVVTSPLQRCEQLSQALLAVRPDLTAQTSAGLQELNFGAWESQRWVDIAKAELDAWTADFAHYRPGNYGENTAAFMARVARAYDDLPKNQHTVWLTHAGVIRACGLIHQGVRHVAQATQWPQGGPAFGCWTTLEL